MKRELQLTMGWAIFLGGAAFAQADRPTADPWLEESDQLPPPEHAVQLTVSSERDRINRYDPLIVRVTLTNKDAHPLTLETRRDGAPYTLASLVGRGSGPFERADQWLMRSGPEYRDRELRKTLQTGESTRGEFLIVFAGPPTGLPFAEPGRYRVRVAFQPDAHFAPNYSNDIIVTVSSNDDGNGALLRELDALFFEHHGHDREAMIRNVGPEYHVGIDLLKHMIAQDRPHLVAPDERPQDQKEAELVHSLAELLDRHPNTTYSGYIARYLGLVHIKTFEHKVSFDEGRIWRETGKPPTHDADALKKQPAYKDALRYLTLAEECDLWPRTTAIRHLAMLHVITQEWEKVHIHLNELRTRYRDSNGAKVAAEVEAEMSAYRAKVDQRVKRKDE